MNIDIYCDGACKGNPGIGGYGVVVLFDGKLRKIIYGGDLLKSTTNNEMELLAIECAYKFLDSLSNEELNSKITIYTDSAYCYNILTSWAASWERNGWTRPKGEKIKNLAIIKRLYQYCTEKYVGCQLQKVQGHVGIEGNELADALASKNQKKADNIIKTMLAEDNCTKEWDEWKERDTIVCLYR